MNDEMEPLKTLNVAGCQFSYRVVGAGSPIVLIQGVSAQGDAWQPQVDALRDRYRCLTFDNRGFGASQPVGQPLSVPQMAADTLALLDAEGFASAHVIGHSLGGTIALELALTSPQRVRSLSLLCTFANGKDAGKPTLRMIWLGARTRIGTRRMRRMAFLELIYPPSALKGVDRDALAERLGHLFGHDLGDLPPIVNQQLAALQAYNATPRLGELAHIPTLVMSAGWDPISQPATGRLLTAGIPNAEFIELAHASHGVTLQQPDVVNELLGQHLETADQKWNRPQT